MTDDRTLESRRELENLRQRYQEHRRTIRHLLQTAPDERLATRYEATLTELQKSIDQLDRIDRESPEPVEEPFDPNETRSIKPAAAVTGLDTPSSKAAPRFEEAEFSTQNRPWNDPLVKDETAKASRDSGRSGTSSPLGWIAAIIVLVGIILGIYLFWPDSEEVRDEPVSETIVEEPMTEEEPSPPALLSIEPSTYDYGIIQKGTRSVHRFTIRNRTDQPLPISVERSDCRCLWYDYQSEVLAGGSVELAITVDGARAEAGTLNQTVTVRSEALADAVAEIDLTAEIVQQ